MDDAAGGSEEISCSHPLQAGIVIVKGQGQGVEPQAITAVLHSSASAVAAADAVSKDCVADVPGEAAGEGAIDQPPPTMSQRPASRAKASEMWVVFSSS